MHQTEIIILTKEGRDGLRLKHSLSAISRDFKDVKCLTPAELTKPCDCKYLFSTWYMPELSVDKISEFFPKLECVFYAAGTVKYFAEPFLKKGIRVFSAAKANGIPVAEFVASQIILANKGYFQAAKNYRKTVWTLRLNKARQKAEIKAGNYNSTIGIIGCGAIGSSVIELLSQYKLNILVYDPYVSDEKISQLGATRCDLEQLFRESDVISNHLPDTPATEGLIDYPLLSQMKPWTTFINTGRGRQVNEKALAKVMRGNKDMCALLDVTTHEPLYPWSPLYFCKNVFLSPHIAGSLSNEFGRMVEYMVEAYRKVRHGEPCVYEVSIDSFQNKA